MDAIDASCDLKKSNEIIDSIGSAPQESTIIRGKLLQLSGIPMNIFPIPIL